MNLMGSDNIDNHRALEEIVVNVFSNCQIQDTFWVVFA